PTTRLIDWSIKRVPQKSKSVFERPCCQYYTIPTLRRAKAIATIIEGPPKWRRSAFGVLFEEFDGVADRQDGLGGVVGNFAAEFLLERHDEFDRVEAVGTEIIDEARVLGHLVRLDAQLLYPDLFPPLANVAHRCNLVSFALGSVGRRRRAVVVRAFSFGLRRIRYRIIGSRADPFR